ncbi:hypothetical protein ACH0BP_26700 [Bacillus nitratireducens]|uniref:hypothetical protein n=1 Tax=Bacillus nitratireducens TaxID=2026193 RepID=UPI0038791961
MGQAKKDLAEQESKLARQRMAIESKGYTYCVECDEPFIAQHGEIICRECYDYKLDRA